MRIAILLVVLGGSVALGAPAEPQQPSSSSAAAPEPEWVESLPPVPPRLERGLGRTRKARESDEKQKERENFLSILEDLNSLARGETPPSAGQVPDNYFVIVGVFSDPALGETALFAERVTLDDVGELDEEERERRRRSPVLGMYQQQYQPI